MRCKNCGQPLHVSQYAMDERYKSCPKCSVINGEEHVFFDYPEAFGKSTKRESASHPDGPQSYCYEHRFNPESGIPEGGILCHQLRK